MDVHDTTGQKLEGRETEIFEQNAVGRAWKELETKLLFLSDKLGNTQENLGYINLGQDVTEHNERIKTQKKKREKDILFTLKQIMQALEEHLKAIRHEIDRLETENAQLQQDIDDNKRVIETLADDNAALKDLQDRLHAGEDPDRIKQEEAYQKAAEAYRKQTGNDPDELNPMDILLWQRTHNQADIAGLNAENEAKAKQIAENKGKIEELRHLEQEIKQLKQEAENIADPEQRTQALKAINDRYEKILEHHEALKKGNKDLRNDRETLQESYRELANRDDTIRETTTDITEQNVDAEVGEFMKNYAQAQTIEDTIERLTREQELVAGLSDEAKENISWEESTEHLFEQDYFKSLEHTHGSNEPAVTHVPPLSFG